MVAAIDENKYDFIVVNYANGDMVGHTGVYSAIEKAVVAIDACVRDTVEAAKANGYEVIIIADHGNADNAENADGTPNTAHSLNPVPFVYVTENKNARVEDGILAEMTGHDLLIYQRSTMMICRNVCFAFRLFFLIKIDENDRIRRNYAASR